MTYTPAQMSRLRKAFRVLNKVMVFMWRIGMGRVINIWPSVIGRIMIIKHIGRKSGQVRLAPGQLCSCHGRNLLHRGFRRGLGLVSEYHGESRCRVVAAWQKDSSAGGGRIGLPATGRATPGGDRRLRVCRAAVWNQSKKIRR